jgi:hypothetical protein
MRRSTLAVLIALSLVVAATAGPGDAPKKTALKLLNDGLAAAKKEKKHVFLAIGSLGCNSTVFLDQYHKDPAVRKILEPHYVFVRIEWPQVPGGKELWQSYAEGKLRDPIWAILDPSGKRLAVSGRGQTTGYPKSPADLAHYTRSLQIGSPKLTDGDIDVLHQKLKQYGK